MEWARQMNVARHLSEAIVKFELFMIDAENARFLNRW